MSASSDAAPFAGLRVRPPDAGEYDAAERLLDESQYRFAGPLDRTIHRRPSPRCDADGRPVQYFVAEDRAGLVGVMVVSANGVVTEWATVPDHPQGDAVIRALLSTCEAWARDQGATIMLLSRPLNDPPAESALIQLGFRPVAPQIITLRVVHFPLFLRARAQAQGEALRPIAPFRLHLHLEPGLLPSLPDSDLVIDVQPSGSTVVAVVTEGVDARLDTTATGLTEVLFGGRSVDDFFREIAVVPAGQSDRVRTVLTALALDRPWVLPLGEIR